MAEQAINTIYLLGDHPDALCNDLIKNLTRRAFDSPPQATFKRDPDAVDEDAVEEPRSVATSAVSLSSHSSQDLHGDFGDAFRLSQLIFVVGHVAIKHIVFLEFVEKEWKRQKEEREKEEKERNKSNSELPPVERSLFLENDDFFLSLRHWVWTWAEDPSFEREGWRGTRSSGRKR